jgi:MoaA/NifB/PqqE/SkfB family radical SAM enzyme
MLLIIVNKKMINYQDIKHLHMEFSSLCNARCPLCPRNLYGYPYNRGYEETSLSLELIKKSLSPQFIKQLHMILINGNFGDFTSNLESLDIIKYFKQHNPSLFVQISTNGSARNVEFWSELGKIKNINIEFCLDGLEDTHHLYRQDTDFNKIIENAQTFMSTGGIAIWKMIRFEHNKHQIEDAKQRSIECGFRGFNLQDHGRNSGPVFDRKGNLVRVMGDWKAHTSLSEILEFHANTENTFTYPPYDPNRKLSCFTKKERSIYIAADGRVYPCCYMGFNPETYKKGFHGFVNAQIAPLLEKNDLHHYPLEDAIKWFSKVESSWTKTSMADGRIIQCDITCGKLKST